MSKQQIATIALSLVLGACNAADLTPAPSTTPASTSTDPATTAASTTSNQSETCVPTTIKAVASFHPNVAGGSISCDFSQSEATSSVNVYSDPQPAQGYVVTCTGGTGDDLLYFLRAFYGADAKTASLTDALDGQYLVGALPKTKTTYYSAEAVIVFQDRTLSPNRMCLASEQ